MFDGRRAEVVRDAKRATYDESHELHPLFPNGELGELPPEVAEGCTEPDMEPLFCEGNAADCEEQLAELASVDWETVTCVQRVMQALAVPEMPERVAAPVPEAGAGRKLFPIFAAAKRSSSCCAA
jgi:hypothetical protein